MRRAAADKTSWDLLAAVDAEGRSALHLAVLNGRDAVVCELLEVCAGAGGGGGERRVGSSHIYAHAYRHSLVPHMLAWQVMSALVRPDAQRVGSG